MNRVRRVACLLVVVGMLGSYAPLPKDIAWRSRELEGVIAGSEELIAPPSVDAEVGDGNPRCAFSIGSEK